MILPPKQLSKSRRPHSIATQWYRETDNVHQHVFAAINALDSDKRQRERANSKYLSLYENNDTYVPGSLRPVQDAFASKLTFNVIKSCIDAAASKIGKNEPKPEFITTQGDYRLKRKAETLNQYIDGVFYDNELYDIAPDAFVDACLYGTGAISVYSDGERICYDRVDIDELLVDSYEGVYRKPKQMFHVRKVFRDKLLERFQGNSEATEAINKVPSVDSPDGSLADQILIAECWYLPNKSPEGLVGGRHVVALENFTLLDEDYKKDYFPFAFFRWSNRRKSFYGQGLAEELVPTQLKLAKLVQHIDRNMKNTGVRVFINDMAEINPNHITDERGPITIYNSAGGPPLAVTFPAVAPEVYQWIENLYRKAFEITGINQMTAFAAKPPGVDAAVAMQTLADQQTERFQLVGKRYEKFFMDITKMTIDLSRDLYQDNKKLKVKSVANGFLNQVSWKEADLDEDHYRLQCFPVSSFASSPAAKLQQATDMMKLGVLSKRRALQMIGQNPDIKDFVSSDTASLVRVQKSLSNIKHDGTYEAPDSFLDLEEAIETTMAEINRSIVENVPEHNVQLMRQYLDECQTLMGVGAPTQPNPAMGQAPVQGNQLNPTAEPQPLPQSDLLAQGVPQ